jgi:DNA-binding MarR family transcriptional regulator
MTVDKSVDRKGLKLREEPLIAPDIPGWLAPQLDSPTFRLMIVAKLMDRLTSRQLAEFDLTYAQWRLLSRLSIHGELTVRQVADLASVDRAEVSRAAPVLEKKGLTDRRPSGTGVPVLFATPKGRKQFESIARARNAFHRALLADFDEEERRQFDRSIHKVAARLVEMGRTRDYGGD